MFMQWIKEMVKTVQANEGCPEHIFLRGGTHAMGASKFAKCIPLLPP